jgi:hypothetical protein
MYKAGGGFILARSNKYCLAHTEIDELLQICENGPQKNMKNI